MTTGRLAVVAPLFATNQATPEASASTKRRPIPVKTRRMPILTLQSDRRFPDHRAFQKTPATRSIMPHHAWSEGPALVVASRRLVTSAHRLVPRMHVAGAVMRGPHPLPEPPQHAAAM